MLRQEVPRIHPEIEARVGFVVRLDGGHFKRSPLSCRRVEKRQIRLYGMQDAKAQQPRHDHKNDRAQQNPSVLPRSIHERNRPHILAWSTPEDNVRSLLPLDTRDQHFVPAMNIFVLSYGVLSGAVSFHVVDTASLRRAQQRKGPAPCSRPGCRTLAAKACENSPSSANSPTTVLHGFLRTGILWLRSSSLLPRLSIGCAAGEAHAQMRALHRGRIQM